MTDVKQAILDELEGLYDKSGWLSEVEQGRNDAFDIAESLILRHLEGMVISSKDSMSVCVDIYADFSLEEVQSEPASIRRGWFIGQDNYVDVQS